MSARAGSRSAGGTNRPVRAFGDTALLADVGSVAEAHAVAHALRQLDHEGEAPRGVEEVIVGYRSVTVVADPMLADMDFLADALSRLEPAAEDVGRRRLVDIPVAFDGPDLEPVARDAGMSPEELVAVVADTELRVAFLGFLPGFAYLEGLPPPLAALERRPTPRTAVPPGSFALAGGFAAVYPRRSPGGWHLLGRSDVVLFDADEPPYSTLLPGDVLRVRPVHELSVLPEGDRPPLRSSSARTVTIEDPGILSTIQDLGRRGTAHLGVPRAGAADPYALRIANRLVGNDERAACVEATARGPSLRFDHDGYVAVVGRADARVDGGPVPCDAVVPVAAGQVLSLGEILDDLRCYVAVAGGLDIPPVLGSSASDLASGVGHGALRAGDRIAVGRPGRPRGRLVVDGVLRRGTPRTVRVVPGPDDLGPEAVSTLTASAWHVAPESDRMGVRLVGDEPVVAPSSGSASRAMVTGAVQVPSDGRPVVLLCDHATVGGYPVTACVISADIGVLGESRPGDLVRFEVVDVAEARPARAGVERAVERAVSGWYPVTSASR